MDEIREQFLHRGLIVKLCPDPEPESPDSWDSDDEVLIVTTRNRYFDVTPKGWSADELDSIIPASHTKTSKYKKDGVQYHVRRLYMYAHSGVALSLSQTGQFADRWDAGLVGAVLVKVGIVGRGKLHGVDACAASLVNVWNQYLSGDVYGFVVEDSEGEHLDSCWGFYGLDTCKAEAIQAAESHANRM